MEKKILTLFVVAVSAMLFTSCSKDDVIDCKTCGTFVTVTDGDAEELAEAIEAMEEMNAEYCGELLDAYEQTVTDLGDAATTEADGWTSVIECR